LAAEKVALSESTSASIPSYYRNSDTDGGPPSFVNGKAAKDAPDRRGFIVVMEEPVVNAFTSVKSGTPVGEKREVTTPYKGVYVIMPYSFWHRQAGAEPVLLGRGYVWDKVTQIKTLSFTSSDEKWKVVDYSQEEMVRMAAQESIEKVFVDLADAWSPSVVDQKPQPQTTQKQAAEMLVEAISSSLHAPELHGGTYFRPSRVRKGEDGNMVIELDLLNRLPVRAHGNIDCRAPSPAKKPDNPLAVRLKGAMDWHFANAGFDLAPGEKAVITFTLEDTKGMDLASFKNAELSIAGTSSALGGRKKDASDEKPGARGGGPKKKK
jgi:hypothetical protein